MSHSTCAGVTLYHTLLFILLQGVTPVADGNLAYTNILDASYDAVVAALSRDWLPQCEFTPLEGTS